FETSSWWEELLKAGFDIRKPAVVACTGVTLYLTREAIAATLHQIATLAPGSTLAMTFYLPMNLLDEEDKPTQELAEKGARAAGTPFVSFFTPDEILALAREAGFKEAKTISTKDMEQLYFSGRTDGLLPASGEVFLLATI
ncbi:MAG TPA: class I SAM-dependent methyltransferase, partial [Puia sp.]|nr:class I SAM-dependent methyltransferase [Puia sp.]